MGEHLADPGFTATVLARTRRRIEIFDQAGEDWRFAESLKSISEDAAQEYEGRAVLELVQNGHDALYRGDQGRIMVLLDVRPSPGVLYVANEGAPFRDTNFKSITEFALSDKGAGEGIGNKGLGFRSVLQLTDWPEVYSKATVASNVFDGYCFRFASSEDLRALIDDDGLLSRAVEQVSPLALPVPADVADPVLMELAIAGFCTVVRLPLRSPQAADAAREQVQAVVTSPAPLLLFLDRVSALTVEVRDHDGSGAWQQTLTRVTRASELVVARDQDWVQEVDLGTGGNYLLARRALAVESLNSAMKRSVQAREIDEKWLEWGGEGAWVGLGLRLDEDLTTGRLYTFLPMAEGARAPLCAHVHAPFFTKLARRDISEGVALNDHLLNELAQLSVHLLRRLRAETPPHVSDGLVLDLACWEPPDRLDAALAGTLADEPVLPLAAASWWGSLSGSHIWPRRPRPWAVLTPQALARIGVDIFDANVVSERRWQRLATLHQVLLPSGGRSI